jgi:DNA topoisomerase-1
MAESLVVVESPAKAKTIIKFLGKGFSVLASLGHVRALPSKTGSVDISKDFEPKYQVLPQSRKFLNQMKTSLKDCRELYLATDMDREGEAIAWHLVNALHLNGSSRKDGPLIKRITFHEITKEAILNALKSPHAISIPLVNAQQARVVLDYLFGFNLSPFLWRKVRYGLSAGRVQSVALRLICEREKEIQSFVSEEYWTIAAILSTSPSAVPEDTFVAELVQIEKKKLDKLAIRNQDQAQEIVKKLEGATYQVREVRSKEIKRNPPPPFTTSTLQQEASRKLGFSAKKTMSLAQRLYEGVEIDEGSVGLITYMRTDSVHLADSALRDIKEVITRRYGNEYALKFPRIFKQKAKNVQEAHEAIRPTNCFKFPDDLKPFLTPDQIKLYTLIWQRTVASQMAQAIIDSVAVDIMAKDVYLFRANGSTVKFPGFTRIYTEGKDEEEEKEKMLPPLSQGEELTLQELKPEQHFTQPPPRYTEATLVKTLEEYGIGRPSTYATIIEILQMRDYARLVDKRFFPEDTGMTVNELLVNHFPRYVDYQFTAEMEERLDEIARGEIEWKPVVREFWEPFITLIREKEGEVKKGDVVNEKTEEVCPQCGEPLVIKLGRYGKFYACTGFPECRYVRRLNGRNGEEQKEQVFSEEKCEKCGSPMLIKEGRYGKFLACSGYPRCKNIRSVSRFVSLGIACPGCKQGEIVEKRTRQGKSFYGCSQYPKCTFATWDKPVSEPCPHCGLPFLLEKASKRYGVRLVCSDKECGYKRTVEETEGNGQ